MNGNIKAGFNPFGTRRNLYFFSPVNAVRNIIFSQDDTNKPFKLDKGNYTLEITRILKVREVTKLMREFTKSEKFSPFRGEDYYRWRFFDSLYEYLYAYLYEDDKLLGYINLKKRSNMIFSTMEYGYLRSE